MDCLFIYEQYRGMGIGARIMQRIQEEGIKMGLEFLQWQTPDFNKDAIKFYNKMGAETLEKERFLLKINRE